MPRLASEKKCDYKVYTAHAHWYRCSAAYCFVVLIIRGVELASAYVSQIITLNEHVHIHLDSSTNTNYVRRMQRVWE